MQRMSTETLHTPRQQSLIESIAHGEVAYMTHLEGFYFNRPLQFQLADEDQAFLKGMFASGVIWHKALSDVEFDVKLSADEPPPEPELEEEPEDEEE